MNRDLVSRGSERDAWPSGVQKISDDQRQRNVNDPNALRDLIATLWLYTGRYEQTQLAAEQKELFADVVERECEPRVEFDRWWRE